MQLQQGKFVKIAKVETCLNRNEKNVLHSRNSPTGNVTMFVMPLLLLLT